MLLSMYICLVWHGGNNKVKIWSPGPKEAWKTSALFHYVRHKKGSLQGDILPLKTSKDSAGGDQASGEVQPVDLNIHGMKWMKERQHSYRDTQLDFWLLLRPLMDGSEESSHQLDCRLLSVWHWSSTVEPSTYPPHPHQ